MGAVDLYLRLCGHFFAPSGEFQNMGAHGTFPKASRPFIHNQLSSSQLRKILKQLKSYSC